jgi:hypothetical protein
VPNPAVNGAAHLSPVEAPGLVAQLVLVERSHVSRQLEGLAWRQVVGVDRDACGARGCCVEAGIPPDHAPARLSGLTGGNRLALPGSASQIHSSHAISVVFAAITPGTPVDGVLDPIALARIVVESAMALLGADAAGVYVCEPEHETLPANSRCAPRSGRYLQAVQQLTA